MVATNPRQLELPMSERQQQALAALMDPTVAEVLYGGAKGGGKTVFGCWWVYLRVRGLIDELNLRDIRNPPCVGFLGRKIGKDFRTTTLESWRRFIPPEFYTINEQKGEITIHEVAKVRYGGLDRSESTQQFQGAEYVFFFLDQAEECTQDDIMTLRATRNRLRIGDVKPRCNALLTANPRRCWLRSEFILSPRPDQRYFKALPTDNPWLGPDYIDTLRQAFAHRPELLDAYLNGNWDVLEGADIIIREPWLDLAAQRSFAIENPRTLLACDPARFGDDETVIYLMRETEIVKEIIYGQKDTMHTANTLFVASREAGNCPIIVECGGGDIGTGIVDRLSEMGATVIPFCPAGTPERPELYINRRAEAWANAGRMFQVGDVSLHWTDPILRGQLTAPTYGFRNAKTKVQDKDEIKTILGRSPDRADAYVIGLDALRRIAHKTPDRKDRYRRDRRLQEAAADWRAQ